VAGADVAFPEDLKWEHILAPGIHYSLGFKEIPFALMAGIQFSPKLRSIKIIQGADIKNG